jgi:hypothetical protein
VSEKQAKERRRNQGIPIAGCSNWGMGVWHIVLDAYPPMHTKIVAYSCATKGCDVVVNVDINIHEIEGG